MTSNPLFIDTYKNTNIISDFDIKIITYPIGIILENMCSVYHGESAGMPSIAIDVNR